MRKRIFLQFRSILILLLLLVSCNRRATTAPGGVIWNVDWENAYGGIEVDVGYGMIRCAEGGHFIIGSTSSFGAGDVDFYLVRIDESGEEQWSKTYGSSYDDYGRSIIDTDDGSYLLLGYTEDSNENIHNAYLIKIDGGGNIKWERNYCRGAWASAFKILRAHDTGYIIVGKHGSVSTSGDMIIKINENGDSLWTQVYSTESMGDNTGICKTSDGGYAIASYDNTSSNSFDLCVIKTDVSGNQEWKRLYGGNREEYGHAIKETNGGDFIIAGTTSSYDSWDQDCLLLKINANGDTIWTRMYGGDETDCAKDVVVLSNGNLLLAGGTYSFGVHDNIYLIETDQEGNVLFEDNFGGDGDEEVDGANFIFMNDYYECILLGITTTFGHGWTDVYALKLSKWGY